MKDITAMGGSSGCCQKVCLDGGGACPNFFNTSAMPGAIRADVDGASDQEVSDGDRAGRGRRLSGSDPSMYDSTEKRDRGAARKGNQKRVGAKYASTAAEDAGGEGEDLFLANHRATRSKGKDTRQLIKTAMSKDRVCALLEDAEIDTILDTMEFFNFRKGDKVCEQGKVGNTFFVTQEGSCEVTVNNTVCNTIKRGDAFGGLALLYNCPRTATIKALDAVGVWGANGEIFHKVLQENAQKHYSENRKFLDSVRLFDGLPDKTKDRVGEAFFAEVFEEKSRVYSEGEGATAIYFVKKGDLKEFAGGVVNPNGHLEGGKEVSSLGPGDCFGDMAVLDNKPHAYTVVACGRCELRCISVGELREVLGNDLAACLERNFILQGLKKSPIISQFSSTQQYAIVKAMVVKDYKNEDKVEDGLSFAVVIGGSLCGLSKDKPVTLARGQWWEVSLMGGEDKSSNQVAKMENEEDLPSNLKAGRDGCRLGMLTKDGLGTALKELGLSAIGSAEQAIDYTRKMVLAKKVHIFRHLSQEQTGKVVRAFVLQRYMKGAKVITQGEVGTSFFVIASGEVRVSIGDKVIRNLGKNAYFGERALLFDEPRTATIEVVTSEAELWSIEKMTFSQIVKGNMQQELMHRIRLQDTSVTMKDVKCVKIIGAGAAGVVRLVEHKKTKMRYALKRVNKTNGKIPEEVKRECDLLAENDHPFIMTLVKTFQTAKSVYILTELITGGELHGAIRQIPTVLSRANAQFYSGSLVIVLEELCDRNIVYRDLKPENVMLDQQGYLKLIDFGIAKKLEEGKCRTFTMIGTPHYMAPEVMRGHGYSTEVDLWSLGVMLFEFVCGYLPFADELDDPTEVCTAVLKHNLSFPSRYRDPHGRTLMQGFLCRTPKKRLGSGITGYEDIKNAEFFNVGHTGGTSLFNKILGRELDAPVVPKGETYCDPNDVQAEMSDDDELG